MGERTWEVLLRNAGLNLLAASSMVAGLSCGGDSVAPPSTGNLEITTATSGPEPDPDGYAVTIDAGAETSIALNGTYRRDDLEPRSHSVQLTGLASNCTVAGDNPRTVSVTAGATASIEFTVTCGPSTGSLKITASTSGPSPDADGYSITLDGSDKGTLAASAEITLTGLAPGDHQVGLSGIAANCQAQGDNPRTVELTAGATATAAFVITCVTPPPTTGSLTIITATTGPAQDPDGYSFALDGGATQSIGLNATTTLTNVPVGAHAVRLSGVAANCRVEGENPRTVPINAGSTATSFNVSCPSAAVTHWTLIRLGEGGEFHWTDLWGSSPTDLFVTGSRGNVSVIWHYNGHSWSEQVRRNDIGITWIWGSSPTDVFAVSEGIYPAPGVILHYNGTSWSEMAGPVPAGNYTAVWGNSGSDVYASPGVHYDGSSWSWMAERSEAAPNDFGRPYIVAGSSGDLYAFGSRDTSVPDDDCNNCTAHYILHHDGTTWTETFTTADPEENFHALWVGGRNDAWVAVQELPYKLYHFDGTEWVGHVPYLEMETLDDIWGSSPSNLYGVGRFAGIVHYDGISWKKIKNSEGLRVWGTSPTDVFVLGENAVLHGTQ